jgi:phosphate acetyltransferase
VIANKVQPENIELVTNGLKKSLPKSILVNSIPLIHNLNNPTVQEIVNECQMPKFYLDGCSLEQSNRKF